MVYGLWFMVYGLWFMVYGLWFMVYGLWFMVYGPSWVLYYYTKVFCPDVAWKQNELGHGLQAAWFQPLSLSSENPVIQAFAFHVQLVPLRRGGARVSGGAGAGAHEVGQYTLNQVDPQLESAWFQTLSLRSENLVSKFASQFNLCTATARQRKRAAGGASLEEEKETREEPRSTPFFDAFFYPLFDRHRLMRSLIRLDAEARLQRRMLVKL
jgi:hypothetical protein